MAIKLCPFCNGKAEVYEDEYEDETLYMVACGECGITTPGFDSEEDAVNAWNRRVKD